MLPYAALLQSLTALRGQAFYGHAYRVFKPKYMFAPLSTDGAYKNGGRYNPPGEFDVLYLAEDPITALAEARVLVDPTGQMLHRPDSRVILAVKYRLEAVLDLADPSNLSALGTSTQELTGDWEGYELAGQAAPTQELGMAAYQSGQFQALRYPSAQNRQRFNFAVFRDRLQDPSQVEIYDTSGTFSGALPGPGQVNRP